MINSNNVNNIFFKNKNKQLNLKYQLKLHSISPKTKKTYKKNKNINTNYYLKI